MKIKRAGVLAVKAGDDTEKITREFRLGGVRDGLEYTHSYGVLVREAQKVPAQYPAFFSKIFTSAGRYSARLSKRRL
jgi:hypothetical protein